LTLTCAPATSATVRENELLPLTTIAHGPGGGTPSPVTTLPTLMVPLHPFVPVVASTVVGPEVATMWWTVVPPWMSKNVSELPGASRSPLCAESVSVQWTLYAVASSLVSTSAWRRVRGSVHSDFSVRSLDGSGGGGSGGRQPPKGWCSKPTPLIVTSCAAIEPR
jgi:hypothetical protein